MKSCAKLRCLVTGLGQRATTISKGFALLAGLALGLLTASGAAAAEGNAFLLSRVPSLLEGSWEVTIKPYNCTTGVEASAQFWNFSYMNFSAGGTMFETTSNPRFQPGQRSPGYGHWERTGRGTFEAVYQAFIQFDTNPPATPPNPTYLRGSQRFAQLIELIDADNWESIADIRFRDPAGNPVGTPGCARAVATRMP